MKTQPRTKICVEGFYYLVVVCLVFGGALLRDVNLLLILAGLLLGPLILSVRLAATTLRGLEILRKMPHTLNAGSTLVGSVSLKNTKRRLGCWAVLVEDRLCREQSCGLEKPIRPSVLFPYVPAGEERKAAYRGEIVGRGRWRIGPLKVSTRFPFGLLSRSYLVGEAHSLLVLPRLGRLMPAWTSRQRQAVASTSRSERRQGTEGEFYGLRRWQTGDGRRSIHWRTSARTGQLMVRQLEQPRSRDVAIVLDLWQPTQPAQNDRDTVEIAVSFAATIAADLCRRGGCTLSVVTGNGAVDFFGGAASVTLLHEILERLATVDGASPDAAALLGRALDEVDPGTEIVLVSTRPTDLGEPRFTPVHARSGGLLLKQGMLCIDVSSQESAKYFQPL